MKSDVNVGVTITPEGLSLSEVERVLDAVRRHSTFAGRIDEISGWLLGRPYIEAPLGGGADQREVFRASLEGFDCVTYIETVLAMAISRNVDGFVEILRALRYAEGKIDWSHRNHYMIDWARRNEARGFVSNLTTGASTAKKTCRLDLIAGLPPREETFLYYPTQSVAGLWQRIETGDVVLFVSERDTLDVFHIGMLVKRENEIAMRHATRTAGAVIEQQIAEFMTGNQMAGLVLLRPLCRE